MRESFILNEEAMRREEELLKEGMNQDGCVVLVGVRLPFPRLRQAMETYTEKENNVCWRSFGWEQLCSAAETLTPMIMDQVGLAPRFDGDILIDLRLCEGRPDRAALRMLAAFLLPLAEEGRVVVAVEPEAAAPVMEALKELEPEMAGEEECLESSMYRAYPRHIGFGREAENEQP